MSSAPLAPSGSRPSLLRLFQRTEWGLLAAIVVVVLLTGALDSQHNYFVNPGASAKDILRQTALLGIFTLGAAIVIIAGGIDLSSGSVIAFSGTVCATILAVLAPDEMQMKVNRPLGLGVMAAAVAGTLLVGFLIGSFHAWLITVIRLPPFVATLATLVGLRSLGRAVVENVTAVLWSAKSTQIQVFDARFRYLTTSVWLPVLLFGVLAALGWLLMSRTVVGRHLHALGGNEGAARLSGIHTDRLKWLAYCISALTASLAGILYVCEESVADPQRQGLGYELNAIAAAVVGGCSLQGGVGTIPGAVLGALFLRTVIDGVAKVIKTGADVYEGLIVGGLVVVAVAFTRFRQALGQGRRLFAGALGWVTVLNLTVLAGVLIALFTGKASAGLVTGLATAVVLTLTKLFENRFGEWLAARRAKEPAAAATTGAAQP